MIHLPPPHLDPELDEGPPEPTLGETVRDVEHALHDAEQAFAQSVRSIQLLSKGQSA